MGHDAVFWGVVIAVVGAAAVVSWLFVMIYTKTKQGGN